MTRIMGKKKMKSPRLVSDLLGKGVLLRLAKMVHVFVASYELYTMLECISAFLREPARDEVW